jgi:hypothetical protein
LLSRPRSLFGPSDPTTHITPERCEEGLDARQDLDRDLGHLGWVAPDAHAPASSASAFAAAEFRERSEAIEAAGLDR